MQLTLFQLSLLYAGWKSWSHRMWQGDSIQGNVILQFTIGKLFATASLILNHIGQVVISLMQIIARTYPLKKCPLPPSSMTLFRKASPLSEQSGIPQIRYWNITALMERRACIKAIFSLKFTKTISLQQRRLTRMDFWEPLWTTGIHQIHCLKKLQTIFLLRYHLMRGMIPVRSHLPMHRSIQNRILTLSS